MKTAFVVLIGCASLCSAAALEDGAFEVVADGTFTHWQVAAQGATVGPDRVRGKWYRFICDVTPGRFDRITLHLSMADGTGSMWWDNFTSETLQIANPDFEEVTANGALVGWKQDNVNVSIFSDADRTTHGSRSLRMTHTDSARPGSRVSQVIAVQPGAEYRFEFDIFLSDDCTARPNVATLTYESDGKYYGSPMHIRTATWSDIRTERAGHGEHVAAMTLEGGRGELTQQLDFPVNVNAEAAVEIKTKELDGSFRLAVEDVNSGDVLGEAVANTADRNWHALRTRFQKTSEGPIRLRLVGEGRGEVRVDHAEVNVGATLLPPPQHVNWLPADENYVLPGTLTMHIAGQPGPALEGAKIILGKDLAKFGVTLKEVASPEAHLQIKVGPGLGVKDKGPESYSLVVNPIKIWATAETDAGALYAIASLVQLLQHFPGQDKAVALTCEISDYPDMPVRGGFWSPNFRFEEFARYKLNTMYYSTSYWLDWLHDPEGLAKVEPALAEAKKFGQVIYGGTGTFQGNWVYRFHDPNLTEGKWVEEERLTLTGTDPAALRHALVIRTKRRGLTLRAEDGKTVYEEGKDYKVVQGTPLTYPLKDLVDAAPDAIARVEGGRIPDGAPVVASYNYAEPSSKSELCMNEPEATRILAEAVGKMFAKFPNLKCFNLNLDEIAYFNRCGLCRADPRSPEDKLGDWIKALNDAAHAARPDARLCTWDDMLSPYDRAYQMGFADFRTVMPKDVIALTWGYTPVVPQKSGWPTVAWWSEAGVSTILLPWYDQRNIWGWAQVFAEARRRDWPCLGMVDTFWHNKANYEETAICAWRIPRPGERRYIQLKFGEAGVSP